MTFEWTDLTYQQKLAGNSALFIFPLCVLLAYLILAAQYNSWLLPLAVPLIVPMCLLSAIAGVWLVGGDNNVFVQIGLVVLVGLAAKNAILIVEFARTLEAEGPCAGGGGRGLPPAPAADPDDLAGVHRRRGAVGHGQRRRSKCARPWASRYLLGCSG